MFTPWSTEKMLITQNYGWTVDSYLLLPSSHHPQTVQGTNLRLEVGRRNEKIILTLIFPEKKC